MTDIRASGFDSKQQLQEHLDDLRVDGELAPAPEDFASSKRAAEIELSWLRREVTALRSSLSAAKGNEIAGIGVGSRLIISMRVIAGVSACLFAASIWRRKGPMARR